jgi:Pheromone A receptor
MYDTAWNTGTCLYMIWIGLGCLMQSINSIVWNKNMINRVPVYCDICKSFDVLSFEHAFILSLHSNSFSSRA